MATVGGGWDCPFCTFINKQSSFKCDMCKASRGTSTRQARMQPHVLVMHQSTESPKTTKGLPAVSPSSSLSTPPSTSGQSSSITERDRMSSASSSRSSSPMPQWSQNGVQALKVQLGKSSSSKSQRRLKPRGRPLKITNWPRVPNLDYKNGISLDVEYKKATATITEYALRQP